MVDPVVDLQVYFQVNSNGDRPAIQHCVQTPELRRVFLSDKLQHRTRVGKSHPWMGPGPYVALLKQAARGEGGTRTLDLMIKRHINLHARDCTHVSVFMISINWDIFKIACRIHAATAEAREAAGRVRKYSIRCAAPGARAPGPGIYNINALSSGAIFFFLHLKKRSSSLI